jgi:hypothetical protein
MIPLPKLGCFGQRASTGLTAVGIVSRHHIYSSANVGVALQFLCRADGCNTNPEDFLLHKPVITFQNIASSNFCQAAAPLL